MSIVVTGAAGFIGSNIIRGLNQRGISAIIAVDDLSDGDKFRNLADLQIADYIDHPAFYSRFAAGAWGRQIDCVFHEGACSDTMQTDGRFMMANNFEVSKSLFLACQQQGTRLLYASSAATYGGSDTFTEQPVSERPLNVYGYSKLLFDQWVRRQIGVGFDQTHTQVAGLRYFNVYGPREQHKGRMASVAFHQHHQYLKHGRVQLFGDYGGYAKGEHARDFVYIDDVVAVNLWFYDHPQACGLFNLGSGHAQPFNDVALAVVNCHRAAQGQGALSLTEAVQSGQIEYIEFPAALRGKYQCFTQADMGALRRAGCDHVFAQVGSGVRSYIQDLFERP